MARETTGGGTATEFSPSVVQRISAGIRLALTGKQPDWFGPGQPLAPQAQEQAVGRRFDYPFSVNTSYAPRSTEGVSFAQLRGLADACDLVRLAVETRKDQMEKLEWEIVHADDEVEAGPEADAITQFLQSPDKVNDWTTWLRMILEDVLVIDAATIYCRPTLGGQLYSLDQLDGATIKVLSDQSGRRPVPPDPAYQQVLKGFPAVNYTADELLYRPRNPRIHKFYGYSPVEQIILIVNIALRRQAYQLAAYTEGNVPDMIAALPKDWSMEQVKEFQLWWDTTMSGPEAVNLRRKLKMLPGGADLKLERLIQAPLFDAADEWLARVVCYAFSLPPNAFVKQQNRATATNAQEVALTEGLAPLMNWVKRLMDFLITTKLGQPKLRFAWKSESDIDPLVQAQIDQIYVTAKVVTPDEVRADQGRAPLSAEQKAELTPPPPPMLAAGPFGGAEPGGPTPKEQAQTAAEHGTAKALAPVLAKVDRLAQLADAMAAIPRSERTPAQEYALLVEHGIAPNVAAKLAGLAIEAMPGGDVGLVKASMIPLSLAADPEPLIKAEPVAPKRAQHFHTHTTTLVVEAPKAGAVRKDMTITHPDGRTVTSTAIETPIPETDDERK